MFKFSLIITILNLFYQTSFSQGNDYQFSQLDINKGLTDNRVNCIIRDSQSFIWFGTTAGLSRYDGYEFKNFSHNLSDSNSLFSNSVVKIYEGPKNKLWVYTNNGISIYDPNTEKFSNDISKELNRYHIDVHRIISIKKDKSGRFWFLTKGEGAFCYNPENNLTSRFSKALSSKIVLHSNNISEIVQGENGTFWCIYDDGVIDNLDIDLSKRLSRSDVLFFYNNGKVKPYSATIGKNGKLWIYVPESAEGIYCYDPFTKKILRFVKGESQNNLNSNVIYSIVQGENNNIWIGTDHGGINIIDPIYNTVKYLLNKVDDNKSIRGNSVMLYEDNTGIIWAGTTKQGVSYYHKGIIQFPLVRHYVLDKSSLPDDDINCFVEDENQNLWIGTNGGGLIYFNRKSKKYTQFKHNVMNPNSLSNDIIVNMCLDHEKNLWIGTYFGGLDRLKGKNFIHFRHRDNDGKSLSDDRINSIMEDSSSKLWVGTFYGINIYNKKNDNFTHPRYSMVSDYTAVIFKDRQQNIWIGRDKGVDIIGNKTHLVTHYIHNPKKANSLIANDVNCIIQDHTGLFWIGTKEGISLLNVQTGNFINIGEKQGLPNKKVWSILEDNNGRIWVSTGKGIASIELKANSEKYNYEIHKYNDLDGLQGNEFNANAAVKLKNGNLIFGGVHGFNEFTPDKISSPSSKLVLLLTDFQLFNNLITVGDTLNGKIILPNPISKSTSLILDYDENVFSISFAACDYYNPDKIIYQYKLEGFDKNFLISPTNIRKATYTNLDAGDYIFWVRATDNNNRRNVAMTYLHITILPPFWKSHLFYFLYAILALSILLYIRHRGIIKLKKQFKESQKKLEEERQNVAEKEMAQRVHELDLMKIKFFTNVSHEFRTPLTLIISPIDSLIKRSDKPEITNQLLMIKRNGRRLLNLVNQLLDFRKMESKELKLNLEGGDIVKFVKEISLSFSDLAGQNHIGFLVDSEIDSLNILFDHDKIERILFNLLSNSFKFTSSGGYVSVLLRLLSKDSNDLQRQYLEIKVIDNGIGIAKEKLKNIFERFYQVNLPEGLLNQGSGIGLSITSEFVKMHSGIIYAESEPDNGTTITIELPVKIEHEVELQQDLFANPTIGASNKTKELLSIQKRPTILIIDDSDDLRFYLKDNLKQTFNIIEASNGKEGWQKALSLHPSLIVSDVAMPGMNGLELCKKIKNDSRTSHIAVILLTAFSQEEDQLTGLTNGANDYISKPFNFEVLLSKINSLLSLQQAFKKTYQKQREIPQQNLEIVSEDEMFLKRVFDCIENNVKNPNFSVEELSRVMSTNRVSLYKRLLALTGKTPVDCIRTVRLKRAVQLLEKSKLSMSNIAFEVGFNSPAYFAKVFKDEYGTVPSEYLIDYMAKNEMQTLKALKN